VFSAVGGAGLDAFHTHSGTTVYARPWLFEMAIWTPPLFGAAGLLVGLSYPVAERLTGTRPGRQLSWGEALAGFAVFTGLYAMSGYLPVSHGARLVVLLAGAAGLFAWLARTWLAVALAVIAAVVGPLVEALLVHAGAFAYREPDMLGVALWLPALYACGSLAFGAVGAKVME
jgi:hypothetical protein